MESITSFREASPDLAGRFIDVKYHGLVSDPMRVVRQIYWRLDKQLTEWAIDRMQFFASKRSQYKGQPDGSMPGDFALDDALDQCRLEAYCSQFGIPSPRSG